MDAQKQERLRRKAMRQQRQGLVKQMFDQGMSNYDIAREFGVADSGVASARRQYQTTGHIVALGLRSDKKPTNHKCKDCDANLGYKPYTTRCKPCNSRWQIENFKQYRQPFIDKLVTWAEKHGRIPTVDQAADIIGLSRGRAGDYVKYAFGPDTRIGYHTRKPRPYKSSKDQHHASV